MTRINQPLSLNPSEKRGWMERVRGRKKNRRFDKVGGGGGGRGARENRSLSNGVKTGPRGG